jgi:Holliday junction DNA helicase RuvA
MIAWIRGTLRDKKPPVIIVDVGGVGYELEAPMTTFYDLPKHGEETSLFTHMVVREDAQLLYGFSTAAERDMFRSLLKVSGVGPRVGLAILSGISADDFLACIVHEDINQLTTVPGIGTKTAQRLVVEMKDRLEKEMDLSAIAGVSSGSTGQDSPGSRQDAIGALIALGYKPADAARNINGIPDSADMASEDLIRAALKNLSGGAS